MAGRDHGIRSGAALACVLLGLMATAPIRAAEFFFKDGDTVVIIGDSITEQHLYSNYVEMWTVSRFPAWKITFRNSGIGGDRSTGGDSRFQRDVLFHKPTALTVDFGMNDGNYRAFDDAGFKTYMKGLQGMADKARAAQIRVAWITPSPVEKKEDGPAISGYNETLEKYSAGVKEIADRNGGLFVDQFHPFIKAQDRAREANPNNRIGGGDPVHPAGPGQAIMAWAILKGLNFPTRVSAVEIDGVSGRVVKADQCQVTGVAIKDGAVRFQRQDAALPFFPDEAKNAHRYIWVPIRDELNDYGLKVTGLKPGRYEVRLGGKKSANYSDKELAEGVNLTAAALSAGPVADQVKAVWEAVKAKNKYYHDRIFRGVVLSQGVPDWLELKPSEIEAKRQAAIQSRMSKMPELDDAIRRALVTKPHQVEVVPVAD